MRSTYLIWSALTGRNDKKMNKKMVKKYFLIIFLNIFLKFDFRFARRPLVLAVGDLFRYSLNRYHHQIVSQLFLIYLQKLNIISELSLYLPNKTAFVYNNIYFQNPNA